MGLLTNLVRKLLTKKIESELSSNIKYLDTPEAISQAKRIRDGLDKLNAEMDRLCKSVSNHPWCKKERNFGTMKWK